MMFDNYSYGYNPYYNQQMLNYYPRPISQIQGVKFVHSLQEAQACSIPLGTRSIFMNQDEDIFYLKETDFNGVSNVVEYEFKKREPVQERKDYITKEEFEEWRKRYEQSIKQQLISTQPDPQSNGTVVSNATNNNSRTSETTSPTIDAGEESVFAGI